MARDNGAVENDAVDHAFRQGEGSLPFEVKDAMSFYDSDGDPRTGTDGLGCIMMNDNEDFSFTMIADVIEAHPERYFWEAR